MKQRNKWSRTGTEMGSSMSQTLEKLGGGIGGRSRPKKAKTNVSKTGKADSTASGLEDLESRGVRTWRGMGTKAQRKEKRMRDIKVGFGKSSERHLAEAKGNKRLAKKKLKADKKANPSKFVGRTKSGVSRKDRKDYAKLYGDMLPKAEHPYTVKPTQYK